MTQLGFFYPEKWKRFGSVKVEVEYTSALNILHDCVSLFQHKQRKYTL